MNIKRGARTSKPIPTANKHNIFNFDYIRASTRHILPHPPTRRQLPPFSVMAVGKLTTHFSSHLLSSRSIRSARINGFLARADRGLIGDAPSCLFVGPIETANKETLEALYRQVYILLLISLHICIFAMFMSARA